LALLRGTTSGNDRLGTRVQGLSWAACGVAQALLPVSNVWKAPALVTGKSACATTPPIRAPAFDGHAKAAPYRGPDDEPRRRPKYVHLRASRFAALHRFAETLERRRFSAPVLRPVPDIQDFDYFIRATVHNDVRRADEFAGSFHLSGSAKAGEACQLFNAVDNRLRDIPGSGGIVLLDAFNSSFKLVGGFGCPPNQPHE